MRGDYCSETVSAVANLIIHNVCTFIHDKTRTKHFSLTHHHPIGQRQYAGTTDALHVRTCCSIPTVTHVDTLPGGFLHACEVSA